MNLYKYIGELLYDHDCVVVPGLGGFVTNYVPARIHPVLHTFSPPSKAVLFNVRLQANDGILASHISRQENISYSEAMIRINDFVDTLAEALENSHSVEILKVGILYRDVEANLQFEPSTEVNYLLSSFGLAEFVSPAIQHDTFRLRQEKRLYDRPVSRHDRRVPVALKRAAWIGLPAAALLVAGFMSINPLKQLYTQYSGVFIDLFDKKEIPALPYQANYDPDKVFIGLFDKNCYADLSGPGGKPYPFRVSVSETPPADNSAQAPPEVLPVSEHRYYVIGGCFRIKENAERFLLDMKEKGFAGAGLFLPEKKKLYHVYFGGFEDRNAAEAELKRIQEQETRDAWLFE